MAPVAGGKIGGENSVAPALMISRGWPHICRLNAVHPGVCDREHEDTQVGRIARPRTPWSVAKKDKGKQIKQ
jgi:hypothetical protein